ncbi:MAG TPA: ATP-binding protein, partial [Polyangiaceae bacterium]
MKKVKSFSNAAFVNVRAKRALYAYKSSIAASDRAGADVRRLLHELEVHQIELEVQNEELWAARQRTETSLARYTELFDFAPIGYATVSTNQTILEVNHAAGRLLGIERSTLIGQSFRSLVAPSDLPALDLLLLSTCHHCNSAGTRRSGLLRLVRSDGSEMHARITLSVLTHEEPKTLIAFEEISEETAREEQLLRTQNALLEAEQRKNDFLAVLSHELRNPLAAIRNCNFTLARVDRNSDQAQTAQTVIDRQISHLTRLVDDLLDVTRITRGKVRLRLGPVELGQLVGQVLEDQISSFEASGLRLEAQIEPEEMWVDADAARLTQVLNNVLGNAEKFTPSGGLVEVNLRREDQHAVIGVRDNGSGIAPELLQHLFEPFAQAPQAMDRSRGGLGLGLAMVKGLVHLHGGTVGIDSKGEGKGTELTVVLPLAARRSATTPPPPYEDVSRRRRRVLVIEDNHDTANTLKDALTLTGHAVAVAYDGRSGIETAREFSPEVVVCDIGLPEVNGYEVAKELRADDRLKGAYLVALSGYALPEDIQRAVEAGFDRHVPKPPDLEQLDQLLSGAP